MIDRHMWQTTIVINQYILLFFFIAQEPADVYVNYK